MDYRNELKNIHDRLKSIEAGLKDAREFTARLLLIAGMTMVSSKVIHLFNQDYLDLLPAWNMDKIRIDSEGRFLFLEDGKIQGLIMRFTTPEERIRKALSSMSGASFTGEE